MYKDRVDLHIHTTFSDGASTVEQVIKKTRAMGLAAISITDHDTIEAIPLAMKLANNVIEIVPGIELSVEDETGEFHILGYFIDYKNNDLLAKITFIQEVRRKRIRQICEKLNSLGKDVSAEEVLSIAPNSYALGRMHVAQILLVKKYIKNIKEAFDHFLSFGKPCYVKKMKLSAKEAIALIRNAGGVAVLAHPCLYRHAQKEDFIPKLVDVGLQGLEVYHPEQRNNQIKQLKQLAKRYDLLMTGGSDYHGKFKKRIALADATADYAVVSQMKSLSYS